MFRSPKKPGSEVGATAEALSWRDSDTPVSKRFDDSYFSHVDGLAEKREVFIAGNGLPERWQGLGRLRRQAQVPQAQVPRVRVPFRIAELGFGVGLSALATIAHWLESAADRDTAAINAKAHEPLLEYTAFEAYPPSRDDLARVHGNWPELDDLAVEFLDPWPPTAPVWRRASGDVLLTIIVGDARETISTIGASQDAWFLDGFSPAKNPELWGPDILRAVYERTVPGGSFATYTAAGWVRRNLEAVGFEVEKVAGYGRKRERLQGRRGILPHD